MKKYKIYILVVVIATFILIAFFRYNSVVYRTVISEFELTPSLYDSAGIATNSHFFMKSDTELTPQVLEKYVRIVPNVNLSIKKVMDKVNTYEIIPTEDFKPNQIYTVEVAKGPLAVRDFSWAYQVKAKFQLTSSVPNNATNEVPINTGIELNFNRKDVKDPEKFIEISPKIDGKFEVIGEMVRFIPSKPLDTKTLYTVKIKQGLQALNTDDTFAEAKTIQFQTEKPYAESGQSYVSFSRQFTEFNTDSAIIFGVYAYQSKDPVQATVYHFDTVKEYLESVTKSRGETPWIKYANDLEFQFSQNKKVLTSTLQIEKNNDSYIVRLPQTLKTGYYAVIMTSDGDKDISWFQVSPVASFVALAGTKSLVWLKDISTGTSIPNIPIYFNDKKIGQTGSDGVANFATPSSLIHTSINTPYADSRKFFVAKTATLDIAIPIENEYGSKIGIYENNKWWNYISLNKNIYLPSDTIRFWAIEKGRQKDITGAEVSVKLTKPYWSESSNTEVAYAETKLVVSDYSTITGELSYKNLKPGIYELTFSKKDEIIAKETVTITAYIKPAYKILITQDKNIVFAGDTINFKVKAELFDGTALANTDLKYVSFGAASNNSSGNIRLDSNGEASFSVNSIYSGDAYYWPEYLQVSVKPTLSEEGQIESSTSVFVFGPHIHNSIVKKQTAGTATYIVTTRNIDLKKKLPSEQFGGIEEYLGAPLSGIVTDIEISEVVYNAEQTGTGYDVINKLAYPIYNYSTEYKIMSEQKILSGSDGITQITYVTEKNKTYRFIFKTTDSMGRSVKEGSYVYGGQDDQSYLDKNTSYNLVDLNDYKGYKVGDTVELQIQTSQGRIPPVARGSYIFIIVNNGNIEYKIQDGPRYSGVFENKDIPNIGIWPGWFIDGRFHNSFLQNLTFDSNERRLNIEVNKNKQSYRPGETVSLDIKVTDKNNYPVKAEVNLSALDEAVFSMREDSKDILSNLYRDIYSQLVIRTSNKPPYGGGGAEKGGGGDGAQRSDFQEVAIYRTMTTDSNGFARAEFKLPDNVTSWRLTSQAVTKDLFAGKSFHEIPVTLPYFIDTTLNNTYLAGDDLSLRIRTFGTAKQDKSNYIVESPTLPFKKIERLGDSSIQVPLGKLTLGNHSLNVASNGGKNSDSLTRKIKVLSSYFTKNTSDFNKGVVGIKIKNDAVGYTELTFDSSGRGKFYNQLKSLSYSWGARLDQAGTKIIALNFLNKYFSESNEIFEFDSDMYQNYSGGLRLLPYSSDDLRLSAVSAHLFKDSVFDNSSLKNYLYGSLNDTKSDSSRVAIALYGLTAFKEPVLTKIQALKTDPTLKAKDAVFVAMALNTLGSKEEARSYYNEKIRPFIKFKESYAYLSGLNDDETILATLMLASLTSDLDEPESEKLATFTSERYPKNTLSNFERLLYIKSAISKLSPKEVSFSFKTGAKNITKTLKNGELYSITLSPEELTSFELTAVKGDLVISSSYEKASTPKSIVKDSNISIERNYVVNGAFTNKFNEGDIVKVSLVPKFGTFAPNGYYQITDHLPSGLRPVDQVNITGYASDYVTRVYPIEINDQKVTFVTEKNIIKPIYYYARVITKGIYKAEPALMQSLKNIETTTISNEDLVTIK